MILLILLIFLTHYSSIESAVSTEASVDGTSQTVAPMQAVIPDASAETAPVLKKVTAKPKKKIKNKKKKDDISDIALAESDPALKKKIETAQSLVQRAVTYFEKNDLEKSCDTFSVDPSWREGELFVFIFDADGVCYSFGQNTDIIWQRFDQKKNDFDQGFLQEMLEQGTLGGLVNFTWNFEYANAYVKNVDKDGKRYILGAAFYPASGEYLSEFIVHSAVQYLKKTNSIKDLFSRINNPVGLFVRGDIYIYALDFEGNCVAHGDTNALIGQNLMDYKTATGQYRTKDTIEIAQKYGSGWYEYAARQGGATKRAYIYKITDPETNKPYILVSGYFPDISDETVRSFLYKTIAYLKANGSYVAFKDFSTKSNDFVYGNISIFVYDMEGTMLADSQNPAYVGLNLINSRDTDGKYITKDILDTAKKYGKGWISFANKNSYQVSYVEKVQVPDGDFVIGASYFPHSKKTKTGFLGDKAAMYMQRQPLDIALKAFTTNQSDFLQGDLSISVYNSKGICLADGINTARIWQDDAKATDDKGDFFVKKIISIAKSGGGWVEYPLFKATKKVYVKPVEKTTANGASEVLAVCCGYYE